jgi:8-oxo-dGTP pyrophosphatase MutT (NUDIX family)
MAPKVCPIVSRMSDGTPELLAFQHPSAGRQFVKGGINDGESPSEAALRELEEESGIVASPDPVEVGEVRIGSNVWHFFAVKAEGVPDRWDYQTRDDFGHVFSFFWHPLGKDLDEEWHPQFHRALEVIRRSFASDT